MSLNEATVDAAALEWFGALGFPPDLQEEAVKTLLARATLLCADGRRSPRISHHG